METKVCNKCKSELALDNFREGRRTCKKCVSHEQKVYKKTYNELNKDKLKERAKAYNELNKEKRKQYNRAYLENNRDIINEKRMDHYEKNKEHINKKREDYNRRYMEKIRNEKFIKAGLNPLDYPPKAHKSNGENHSV